MNFSKLTHWIGNILQVILIILFSLSPIEFREPIYHKINSNILSYKLNRLRAVDSIEKLSDTKDVVIEKINNSKIILNKNELINRVNNVRYVHYESTYLLNGMEGSVIMAYCYDITKDIDYIIIKDTNYIYNKYVIIHELNHLIDEHKKVQRYVEPLNLITGANREIYTKFYKDWNLIDRSLIITYMLNEDGIELLPNRDKVSIGDVQYAILMSNSSYYLSNPEIYSRLSGMKSFMLDKKAILDVNDPISEELILLTINSIKNLIDSKKYNDHEIITLLSMLDWLIYVPIINYDNICDLNLII